MTDLKIAAQAVLDRWDSPRWKWDQQGSTAELMHVLRAAIAHQCDQAGEVTALDECIASGQVSAAQVEAHRVAGDFVKPVQPTAAVTDALTRLKFFRDLTGDERFKVLQAFGAVPDGVTADDMNHHIERRLFDKTFTAAIAQPEQKEPVRQPLTRMAIQTIVIEVCDTIYPQDDTSYSEADSVFYGAFARAIEAAHGIAQLVQPKGDL